MRLTGAIAALTVGLGTKAAAQVYTQHNDLQRTGVYSNERSLTPSNVNVNSFGRIASYAVDGFVYAQPLAATIGLRNGQFKSAVFIATEHNSVYAFDATAVGNSSAPLWHVNLGPSESSTDIGDKNLQPEIGITSTPVYDPSSSTLFVEAATEVNGKFINKLHALNVMDGSERPNSPVVIAGSVAGTGDGSSNGTVTFDDTFQMNRPALTLYNGIVYVGFGSHVDRRPYHGWIFGYHSTNMSLAYIYNVNPNDAMGAVWQGGNGLAVSSSGKIVFGSGNGGFSTDGSSTDLGNSFVQLTPTSGGLQPTDWFIPYNSDYMNSYDLDLGSSGPVVINDFNALVGGGKLNTLYEVSLSNMGRYDPNGDHVLAEFPGYTGGLFTSPVYYNDPVVGPLVFTWSSQDVLKAFTFDANGVLLSSPLFQGTQKMGGHPGGAMSISSNGHNANTAILWATGPLTGSNKYPGTVGVLRAYNIENLSTELWDSEKAPNYFDRVGFDAKFNSPMISNGRVYVATFSDKVVVYGLKHGLN